MLLQEQINELRAEAVAVEVMDDSQVIQYFQDGRLGPPSVRGNCQVPAGQSQTQLEHTAPASMLTQPSFQQAAATTASDKADQESPIFDACLDDLEAMLSQAETFVVSEKDSEDFQKLCMKNYEKSLQEAGMDSQEVEDVMCKAAETGEFDITGGKIGNMWARLPKDNPFKVQSAQARGRQAKEQIRKNWCKETFAYILEEKTHEESYSNIDVNKGEFFTFGGLVRELGGWKWPPAVTGAKLHFIRAMRLGGQWVTKDQMSSLTMVLRLKPSFTELMENKWSRFTKFHNQRTELS